MIAENLCLRQQRIVLQPQPHAHGTVMATAGGSGF
jgi:hypothetical protein